ncbi:MAG TPA: glycosyltransferase family 4 protein, partial [Vicinamibacteria bacterium]|nr:glycosyltransferase family 4 protein [Vicinamibacteria bacterium]
PYPTGRVPGQRYRIEQWAPHLAAEGLEVTFAPFFTPAGFEVLYRPGHRLAKASATLGGYARRLRRAWSQDDCDVAYVYREAAPLAPAWLDRRLSGGRPVVFDFDDAIYLATASPTNAWAAALRSPRKTDRLCREARHVTVGNEHLAQYARSRARAVTVIPPTIDTDLYVVRESAAKARPVVGWTGSLTTLPHLAALAPALARLARETGCEVEVIGGELELPGVPVRCRPWRAANEVDDLRSFDVGLMPLPDDEWARGKCGMKALQYMALGIPPVVSPVGVNATLVRDGVNGFHARTEDEWVDRVGLLLRDADLRARLGGEARRTVEEGFSARVQAPRLARVLRDAAGAAAR